MSYTDLSGWGGTPVAQCDFRDLCWEDLAQLFEHPPNRGVTLRGLGRSYGDAAQNSGGVVLSTEAHDDLVLDPITGLVDASAGVSFDTIMRTAIPQGWLLPVTPGTRNVTLGGAFAADVHGKNHHADGGFCDHCLTIDLVTPATGAIRLNRGDSRFNATAGGMGLTGVISRVKVQMVAVETSWMVVETVRAPNLDELLATLSEKDDRHRFTVAWIDLLVSGQDLGRGIVTSANLATASDLDPRRQPRALEFAPRIRARAPSWVPNGLLNRATMTAFNTAWFHRAPKKRRVNVQSMADFFYPLDGVSDWNRLYGPAGFVQYQFVVPWKATSVLSTIIEALAATGCASFLAVVKRFGSQGSGHLSFPIDGWTLAVDLPATPDLVSVLNALDEEVVEAGGRVYLAKDSRMSPRHLRTMYPRLDTWRELRNQLDPKRILTSDLDRRLDLCGRLR